ncbi:MAG: CBS domain-containing protein [Verrucomicrobiae bacterium]|nr:CBS domain-containing protein [Verrucomicrobiae bacterium]MCX7722787.1 CBS domain-containing protein [Verrucomicrobiae bacterium]
MKVVGIVADLLRHKGHAVWSISPDATVHDAIKLLAEKNIGAVVVLAADKPIGIFSERDCTRRVALHGYDTHKTRVKEVISAPVITVTPEHTVEDCMRLMTEHRVRHLPVMQGDKLVGLVSIGDVVNWVISAQSTALQQMESYISGQYPG